MSEEWRRGWHPEKIQPKKSNDSVLIVGAGPAGLEAAHALGKRGYSVMLAEAARDLGGRVKKEAQLPGLNEWIRVRDYRIQQIDKMDHVEIFRESKMSAEQVLDIGADHIAIATGAAWRRDGYGANALRALPEISQAAKVYSPDDIMSGMMPEGPVVVYDDDHYYMGTVIAEAIRKSGVPVTLVTPEDKISTWGSYTMDRSRGQAKLMKMGVEIVVSQTLSSFDSSKVALSCNYTGACKIVECASLVLVTARQPNDGLYQELSVAISNGSTTMPKSLKRIGDCEAPAIIAAAVYSGHRYARHLEEIIDTDNPLKHDRVFYEDN
jgi:dimethylamine/trimethylamine dehydrogenase